MSAQLAAIARFGGLRIGAPGPLWSPDGPELVAVRGDTI